MLIKGSATTEEIAQEVFGQLGPDKAKRSAWLLLPCSPKLRRLTAKKSSPRQPRGPSCP